MEPLKFNADMPQVPKRQGRALGTGKGFFAQMEGDVQQEKDNDDNIKIPFLSEDQKKEILKDYCRDKRPIKYSGTWALS